MTKLRPIEQHTLSLIKTFLESSVPPEEYQSYQPEIFVKEYGSIRIDLPRDTGSTTIAKHVCHQFHCLVICPNQDHAKEFSASYLEEYDEDQPPTAIGVYALKKETSLTDPNIQLFLEIKQALDRSNIVLCEVFRAFSNNKGIKRLFQDAGFSHRFILI